MRILTSRLAPLLVLVAAPRLAGAQSPHPAALRRTSRPDVALVAATQAPTQAPTHAPTQASVVASSLAGAAGSLAGIGAVMLTVHCTSRDNDEACGISRILGAGAAGIAGSVVAVALFSSRAGVSRSAAGALLGSTLGTALALGAHYALNHDSARNLGDTAVIPLFVIGQGVGAALGSRAFARRS
ncbi:MAG: hypothetical protein JWO05_3664 [Gemmatimonadetes bacterium]|nr:hypothetical protein [Gemmatimonadota bacterium]